MNRSRRIGVITRAVQFTPMLLTLLGLASAAAFSYYGASCWFAERLKVEYLRYGVPHLRGMLGTLQLLGAAGVLLGFIVAPLGAAAATGLALMMWIGVAFRLQLGDRFVLMIPAFTLAVLNTVLAALFFAA